MLTLYFEVGKMICVGPTGGAYVLSTVAVAVPIVYTTTATPAVATASGTIANCGLYYEVVAGDYCNLVAVKYSLAFSELIAMNPSINSACSNLEPGVDCCVAAVNGTSVSITTTILAPSGSSTASTSSSSTFSISITTATSTYPTPPAETLKCTISECNIWYVVASGDGCDTIEALYDITLAQILAWNTYIDTACNNLWPDYTYCVSSPIGVTTTTILASPMTSSTASTTSYVPASTQTITSMTSQCLEWYVVQSGNGCDTIESLYGITLAQFIAWNTHVDTVCNNILPDYTYYVSAPS